LLLSNDDRIHPVCDLCPVRRLSRTRFQDDRLLKDVDRYAQSHRVSTALYGRDGMSTGVEGIVHGVRNRVELLFDIAAHEGQITRVELRVHDLSYVPSLARTFEVVKQRCTVVFE